MPINSKNDGNLNFTTNINYTRNASLINSVKNYIGDVSIGEEIRFSYNYDDKLDLGVNASITYSNATYSIQKGQTNSYFTHNYSLDATYSFNHGIIFSTNGDYVFYSGSSGDFNQGYFIWNASIAKQLFKNERGEIAFSVNDILNQATNISRIRADNFIEDVQTTTLKRFALLTFTYHLR